MKARTETQGMISRLPSRPATFLHDLLMVPIAWVGAYWLRFNLGEIPDHYLVASTTALTVVVPVQAAVLWFFGLYRGVWRFASMPDLVRIAKAVLVGAALIGFVFFMTTRLDSVPRSVLPLYIVLLGLLLGTPRFIFRWFKDAYLDARSGQRVVVMGAGKAGELLVRDLFRDAEHRYWPVAFLDDNPAKRGTEVHGVRVAGACDELPLVVQQWEATMVMIAIPSADSRAMKRLVRIAEQSGLPMRTLPSVHDVIAGRVGLQELREVSIEDLLGREPVALDWGMIRGKLARRVVLITGGGGSIGSELCRQVARLSPQSLVVLERSEFNLYRLESELKAEFPEVKTHLHLGDVCDGAAVRRLMDLYRPEVVFHAAAYKHVPILESQLREAVHNNVLGTRIVADAAAAARVQHFVLISTDKAVNPVNVMGASKRLAEVYCQNLNQRSQTSFVTVRFGNVLGSAGSVVPRFQEQIAQGGPVTVTHPEVARYFMTIPEACQLIMQAAAMGTGGEIFVLEMGEPVTIKELAEQMIDLAGKVPGEDIEIVYTGLRPGEKLSEELFHAQEPLAPTSHRKILLAHHRAVEWQPLKGTVEEMARAVASYDEPRLAELVQRLVPEYAGRALKAARRAKVVPFTPRVGEG